MQIGVNVFATLEEIDTWIREAAEAENLHFALVHYWPDWRVVPLGERGGFRSAVETTKPRELWIDLRPLDPRGAKQLECLRRNAQRLALHLPERVRGGFREGWLVTAATDPERLRVWRSIVRRFKSRTTGGMWVSNPTTHDKGFYQTHRYSPGIQALARQGVKLLPFAGGNILSVDEPSS